MLSRPKIRLRKNSEKTVVVVQAQHSPSKNSELKNLTLSSLIGAGAAGLFAYLVSWSLLQEELQVYKDLQEDQLNSVTVFQTVQTRIDACVALAQHHFAYKSSDERGIYLLLDDASLVISSTNAERHRSSINMARALSLCLEKSKDAVGLSSCIANTTTNGSGVPDDYVSVFDTRSSKPVERWDRPRGKRNPAC